MACMLRIRVNPINSLNTTSPKSATNLITQPVIMTDRYCGNIVKMTRPAIIIDRIDGGRKQFQNRGLNVEFANRFNDKP